MLVLAGHVQEFLSCRMIFSAFQFLNLNIKEQNVEFFLLTNIFKFLLYENSI
jgi:hypothetical protein